MKKTLLLICSVMFSLQMFAQTSGGPDTYGYVWRDSNDPNGPTYNWVDLTNNPTAVEVTGLADDNFVGPFSLPTPFPYYWYTANKFWIGSNGYLGFNSANIASPFPTIPNISLPHNYLAILMSDLNFTDVGNVAACYYWISPNSDSLVVSWIDVPFWANQVPSYTGLNSFQVILNYADSTITFQYKEQTGTSAAVADFVGVGIENLAGTIGLEWAHDVYPSANYAIRFYQPSSTTLQINDAATLYNDNDENGARFISKAGATFPLTTEVKNAGNTTLTNFNVQTLVRASNNAVQVTNTSVAGPLTVGQTQIINQPSNFNPVNAGVFRIITDTQLAGDATPSNNQKITELNVVDTVAVNIELSYDNGIEAGQGGISWSGGNGGVANYFIPPFYPCDITAVKEFIVADPLAFGFYMKVWDDSGPNNSPGVLLDSIFVAPGFTLNTFTTTPLTAPIRINSGGFYVEWYMAGDQVSIGQNGVAPISNRTYEVLGNSYAQYRTRETLDHMIRAVISRVGVGINEVEKLEGVGSFYPNPASDFVIADIDRSIFNTDQFTVSLFDNQGKLVSETINNQVSDRITIDVRNVSTGIYLAKITSAKGDITRKISVSK